MDEEGEDSAGGGESGLGEDAGRSGAEGFSIGAISVSVRVFSAGEMVAV